MSDPLFPPGPPHRCGPDCLKHGSGIPRGESPIEPPPPRPPVPADPRCEDCDSPESEHTSPVMLKGEIVAYAHPFNSCKRFIPRGPKQ